jgi:hypothetical protein
MLHYFKSLALTVHGRQDEGLFLNSVYVVAFNDWQSGKKITLKDP